MRPPLRAARSAAERISTLRASTLALELARTSRLAGRAPMFVVAQMPLRALLAPKAIFASVAKRRMLMGGYSQHQAAMHRAIWLLAPMRRRTRFRKAARRPLRER